MAEFLMDLYIWINFVTFWVACVDKARYGSLKEWFWLGTCCFGGLGTGLASFLIRHRTKSGDAGAAIVIGVVQLILVKLIL